MTRTSEPRLGLVDTSPSRLVFETHPLIPWRLPTRWWKVLQPADILLAAVRSLDHEVETATAHRRKKNRISNWIRENWSRRLRPIRERKA